MTKVYILVFYSSQEFTEDLTHVVSYITTAQGSPHPAHNFPSKGAFIIYYNTTLSDEIQYHESNLILTPSLISQIMFLIQYDKTINNKG